MKTNFYKVEKGALADRQGIMLIDKPEGLTSHDVVALLRKIAMTKKVGHSGTLDPMATGLMVLAVGRYTRLLQYFSSLDKEYYATIRLGASTTTDDAQGDIIVKADRLSIERISEEKIKTAIKKYIGSIMQVPSSVSAIKVSGKRAYNLVRAGESVELPARPVSIYEFDFLDMNSLVSEGFIDFKVRVNCSSGTYIRALARDLGKDLGVGGFLTELRRTRVGYFSIEHSCHLDAKLGDNSGDLNILPASDALSGMFPRIVIDSTQQALIRNGVQLRDLTISNAEVCALIDADNNLLSLVRITDGCSKILTNFVS